jgi:outer membrane immunogenic protein
MKRLVVASLIAAGLAAATSINAADLSPSVSPSAPVYVEALPHSWTGFYFGGHVGGAWVEDRATTVGTNSLIASSMIDSVRSNSVIIGGQVGFNYQMGVAVVGVEADGSWTKTAESAPLQPLAPGNTVQTTSHISWYGTATARVGVAWDNVLLYSKAGVAGMNARYTSDIQEAGVNKRQGVSDRRIGWTAGGGVEIGFHGGWSGKVEYAYLDFGTSQYWLAGPALDPLRHVHMVKAGINWRFGGPDIANYSREGRVADWGHTAGYFYDPNRFELRGGLQSDFLGLETGTIGLAGELIFPRLFTIEWLPDFLTPRFQLGGVVNLAGRTSFVHTDLLWTTNWTERLFSEMFFGVTVHNGNLLSVDEVHNALGCRALFHVGFNLGYRLDQNWRVMATYDHSSAGQAVTGCPANESLNQAGLKFGYQF